MSANRCVVILTAGRGSRLNERTKYFNKAILRVGNKAAISHTIDNFPEDTDFVIALGYKGDLVKQYLQLAHADRNFTFIEVDKTTGPGSGPGYSLMCCKEHLQRPFYYVSCDTIMTWETPGVGSLLELDTNWSAYDFIDKIEAYKYCTIDTKDHKVSEIFNKERNGTDKVYVGVSFVKDYQAFWDRLKDESASVDEEIQIAPVLLGLDNAEAVKVNWLDTGTEEALQNARKQFPGLKNLDKLDEELYIFKDFVVKYFYNENVVQEKLERIKRLGDLVPEILDSSKNFYKYKYITGRDLSQEEDSNELIPLLLEQLKHKLWTRIELSDFRQEQFIDTCRKFYYDKTLERLNKLNQEKHYVFGLGSGDLQYINELLVPKINDLLSQINWDRLSEGIPVNFHGDCVFSNIIFTKDVEFKLIDWRHNFGGLLDYGDIYYDLAKLNTELLIPRQSVINGRFYVDKSYLGTKVFIERSVELEKCRDILEDFIISERYDITKVRTLTGLIILNMAPLHEHPLDEWLYYYGRYYLWKTLKRGIIDV